MLLNLLGALERLCSMIVSLLGISISISIELSLNDYLQNVSRTFF